MFDSQLPRFQVFLQEKPGTPFQDVGSVHAPDAELALQNARDVFVRRPECTSLWVVPVTSIYSRTSQKLDSQDGSVEGDAVIRGRSEETYMVFAKQKSAGTQELLGEVQAASGEDAFSAAWIKFSGLKAFAWWVVPARQITCSVPEDVESMFAPAHDKPFRLSTDFHTLTAMRSLADRRNKKNDR
jgi:ring-1,2-phenylacetyl-CoA epoxidase subunit PaaB